MSFSHYHAPSNRGYFFSSSEFLIDHVDQVAVVIVKASKIRKRPVEIGLCEWSLVVLS